MNAALYLITHPALQADPPKGLTRNLSRIVYDPRMKMEDGFLVSASGIPLLKAGVFEYDEEPYRPAKRPELTGGEDFMEQQLILAGQRVWDEEHSDARMAKFRRFMDLGGEG